MSENEKAMVERAPDPYVTVHLDGVLLVREEHIPAKELRLAVDNLLTHMGRRKVSIVMTTLDPPPVGESEAPVREPAPTQETIHSWRIAYTEEDATTGGAKATSTVVRAPTAADALTMFDNNFRRKPGETKMRYFIGAEHIEIARSDHTCTQCDRGKYKLVRFQSAIGTVGPTTRWECDGCGHTRLLLPGTDGIDR